MGHTVYNQNLFHNHVWMIKSFTQFTKVITSFFSPVIHPFHQAKHKLFRLRVLKLFTIPSFPRPYNYLNLIKNLKYTNKNLRMWKEL